MGKTKIPIDDRQMAIQQCTPERQRLVDEVQRALGDGVQVPRCADLQMGEDGSIRATSITENGTVHAVDIYADGEVTRLIICNPEDSFVETEEGTTQVCENFYSSELHAVSDSKLRKAQAVLLKAAKPVEEEAEAPKVEVTLAEEVQAILDDRIALHSTSEVTATPDGGIHAAFAHPTGSVEHIQISRNGTARRTVVKADGTVAEDRTLVITDAVEPKKVLVARTLIMSKGVVE